MPFGSLKLPLHDVGYRRWTGVRSQIWTRWWAIAQSGIQLVWRGTWLRRTMIVTWLPGLVLAIGLFAFEQSVQIPEYRQPLARFLQFRLGYDKLANSLVSDPSEVRHDVWSALLLTFFRFPQGLAVILVVGIIAPRLISYDIRSRGYLLYFSRPLTVAEYILGKSFIVWTFLALTTTIPAISLYFLSVLLSPNTGVIWDTWDLPLRILIASAVLIVPTTAVALAMSSVTIESRYATFSWFAMWVIGWFSYSFLGFGEAATSGSLQRNGRFGPRSQEFTEAFEHWSWVSPYHTLGRVQAWVFGLEPDGSTIILHSAILIVATLVAFFIIYRRVSGCMRA